MVHPPCRVGVRGVSGGVFACAFALALDVASVRMMEELYMNRIIHFHLRAGGRYQTCTGECDC